MNIKKNTLMAVLGAVLVACASCSDEVPAIPASELYTREFVKKFGVIDRNHTWNTATSGIVNVTVDTESRIIVSGIYGGKRYKLAQYDHVMPGTRTLTFDMPEGFRKLRVTDGKQEVFTEVGGSADFASRGRIIWEKDDDVVKITRTDYRILSDEAVRSFGHYLPEGEDNRGKVVQNFTFVANGPFTIYPVFWQTAAFNTLGIYYESKTEFEEDGTPKIVHVPFYTNKIKKEGEKNSNLEYILPSSIYPAVDPVWLTAKWNITVSDNDLKNNEPYKDLGITSANEMTDEQVAAFKKAFIDDKNKNIEQLFYGCFDYEYNKLSETQKAVFKIDDIKYEIVGVADWTGNVTSYNLKVTEFHFTGASAVVDENGWTGSAGQPCSYMYQSIYESYVAFAKENEDKYATDAELKAAFEQSTNNTLPAQWRARGMHIDIEAGTPFGMYIRTQNNAPKEDEVGIVIGKDEYTRFYSNSDRNPDLMTTDGVLSPCVHASTYMYTAPSGIQYRVFGFEDWINSGATETSNVSDLDMNDMMFFIASDNPYEIPDVVDQDPGEEIEWLIACEDLGNKDDFDFNDVVFSVRHVSGQTTAVITPLAAGGTLEAYLCRDGQPISPEWHTLFGVTDFKQMINTTIGSNPVPGRSFEITVDEDFSLSPLELTEGKELGTEIMKQNMGGLYVQVIRPDGTRDDITSPTRSGEAPQMFLVAQVYHKINEDGTEDEGNFSYKWQWPIERRAIDTAYPEFTDWLQDSKSHADWHTRPIDKHVVKR